MPPGISVRQKGKISMAMDKKILIRNLTGTFYIVIAAALWGSSFAVRKIGMESIGPLMMNTCRFFLAFIFMLIIVILRMHFVGGCMKDSLEIKKQIKVGIIIGTPYAFNVVFQQIGLNFVSAGETGFITSLYTIMVPVLGWIIFKTKIRAVNLVAIVLSGIGLYFVTDGGASFNFGVIVLFIGAICAAIQILLIGKYIYENDPVLLVTVQIGVGTVINLLMAVITGESVDSYMIRQAIGPIIYSGILSVGIANLCQFLGQKKVSPTTAAITCSFESIFGLIFGILLLGETMTFIKACGCAMIFITVIMVQYEPEPMEKRGGIHN